MLTTYFTYVDFFRRHTTLMESMAGQFLVSGSASLCGYILIWPFEVIKNLTQADQRVRFVNNRQRATLIYNS